MVIKSGAPVYMSANGLIEGSPADLETLLYWQQQLDFGDGILKPLSEFDEELQGTGAYTHKFYSETGGVFHVTVEEGSVSFPLAPSPAGLETIERMQRGINSLKQTISRLALACKMMKAENEALRGVLSQHGIKVTL